MFVQLEGLSWPSFCLKFSSKPTIHCLVMVVSRKYLVKMFVTGVAHETHKPSAQTNSVYIVNL